MDSKRISDVSHAPETRLALIHRVLAPEADYPKEYAILLTDRRSVFIRQPKTRNTFWLRGELRWGTALITDVNPKTLLDYEGSSVDSLSAIPGNLTIDHESVASFKMVGDAPEFRNSEFFVKWVMKRQKEIYRVYNFEISYQDSRAQPRALKFCAVPLGAYFKPKRMYQTREFILREYADEILELYRHILAPGVVASRVAGARTP